MATYQILQWKEIPSQIRVEDGGEEIKVELDARLQELIDQRAGEGGATGSDAYLEEWKWSDPQERDGKVNEVADQLKKELEARFLKG